MAEKIAQQAVEAEIADATVVKLEKEGQQITLDAAAEKVLVRKIDFHLLPPLFVLYMLAFIDR